MGGFKKLSDSFNNQYFRLEMKNSLMSLLFLKMGSRLRKLRFAVILPMLLSTAGIFLVAHGICCRGTPVPVYSLFIWKNIGIVECNAASNQYK